MFKTIINALKTPDVRKRILYTLLLIVLFRLGCFITIPGVDTVALNETMSASTNGMAGLIDLISGGAFQDFPSLLCLLLHISQHLLLFNY